MHDVCDGCPHPAGRERRRPSRVMGISKGHIGQGLPSNDLVARVVAVTVLIRISFLERGASGEGLYPRRRSCLCSGASAAGSLPMQFLPGAGLAMGRGRLSGRGMRAARSDLVAACRSARSAQNVRLWESSTTTTSCSRSMGVPGVLDVAVVGSAGVGVALQRLVEAVQAGPDHVDPVQGVDRQAGVVTWKTLQYLAWASTTAGSL
jgi:hypothetical protein